MGQWSREELEAAFAAHKQVVVGIVTSKSGDLESKDFLKARLDEAAKKCVVNWHYRPAVKDGQIVDANWKAKVTWNLATANQRAAENTTKPDETKKPEIEKTTEGQADTKEPAAETAHQNSHPWYDVTSWF